MRKAPENSDFWEKDVKKKEERRRKNAYTASFKAVIRQKNRFFRLLLFFTYNISVLGLQGILTCVTHNELNPL
jgi:hypothetical protein